MQGKNLFWRFTFLLRGALAVVSYSSVRRLSGSQNASRVPGEKG